MPRKGNELIRHSDEENAKRAYLAYNLKLAGLNMVEIAERLEYPSSNAVVLAIREHIKREAQDISHEERDSIMRLEFDRLEYMLSRVWPQVEYGDAKAIDSALKIIQTEIKVAGLDQVDMSTSTQTVLVVGGSEQDYINKLKEAAGELE